MMQRTAKITLLSNDKDNSSIHKVSDYTFNQMSKEEQDDYLHMTVVIGVTSDMGHMVGHEVVSKLRTMVSDMEDKYNPKKPETLFEMKRRLLKQGLK